MEGNARKADGEAFPSKRESRFSDPVLKNEPGSEDLKKAAEAIKQEYKSLIQHLTHLHGAGVGSSTQAEERALSMFAPNMQLPPELKGLKEQEKERKERLKELRDTLRKRKEVEPAGLMDWFESDGGSFIQGRAAKMAKQADKEQTVAEERICNVANADSGGVVAVDPLGPNNENQEHEEVLSNGGGMEGDVKLQVEKVVKAEELEPKECEKRDRRSGDGRRSGEGRHSRREDRRRSSHKEEHAARDRNRGRDRERGHGRDRDRDRDREKGRKRHADHKRERRSRENEQDREVREKSKKRDQPRSRDERSRKRSSSREKRGEREAMRPKRESSVKKGSPGNQITTEHGGSKVVEKSPAKSPEKVRDASDQTPDDVQQSAEVVVDEEKDKNDVPSPTAGPSCEADPSCEQAGVEAKLKELHVLETLIAGGGVLQWYQDKVGGCEAFSTGDKGEGIVENESKRLGGAEVVNLVDDDEEAAESTSGLKRLQRAAEKAIENEQEELIAWLKSRDPDFRGNPDMTGCKEDASKTPEIKRTVVIKRNSFFPVPRAKPKQENPDFAIVKPAVVPKIVFKENGSAETVRPAEADNALELCSSQIIHPLAMGNSKNSESAPINAVPPSMPKQHTVVYQLPGVLSNPMFRMPNVRTIATALGPQGHRPLTDQRPPSFGTPQQQSAPGGFMSGAPFPGVATNTGFLHQSPAPPMGPLPLGIHMGGRPEVGGHPPTLPQVSNPQSLRPRMPGPPQGPPPVHPPSRPPPPRTLSGGFPAESMGNHPMAPQVPVPPPRPPPPPANAFRVPPPPIPDMSAQGPAYEIGKDEEESPTGSPHAQVPPPPPPLTSHPMYRPEILGRNMEPPSPHGPPPRGAPPPVLQQGFQLGPLGFPGNVGGRFGPRGPQDHFRPPPSMQPPPPTFPRPHHL